MTPLIVLFYLFSTVFSKDICINNVFFHREGFSLPSTGPFCVTSQPDPVDYLIQTAKQSAEQLERLENEVPKRKKPKPVKELLLQYESTETPLYLPISLTSEQCTTQTSVVLGKNVDSSCLLSRSALSRESCESSNLLNFQQQFSYPIISLDSNNTEYYIEIRTIDTQPIENTVWENDICFNVLKEIEIQIVWNGSQLLDAVITLFTYSNLTANDINNLKIRRSIKFVKEIKEDGYIEGAPIRILTDKGEISSFMLGGGFACPSSTVKFLVDKSIGCLVSTSSCQDANTKSLQYFSQNMKKSIITGQNATYHVIDSEPRNFTSDVSSCEIIVSERMHIMYSKFGKTTNYSNVIVAVYHTYRRLKVSNANGVTFSTDVVFKDVTSAPVSTFASLPKINIKLPKDFFYPFVSSVNREYKPTIAIITYVLYKLVT